MRRPSPRTIIAILLAILMVTPAVAALGAPSVTVAAPTPALPSSGSTLVSAPALWAQASASVAEAAATAAAATENLPSPDARLVSTVAGPAALSLPAVASAQAAAKVAMDAATEAALSDYIVGYDGPMPTDLLDAVGATVVQADSTLGFAVVHTNAPQLLSALVGLHPALKYVVKNGPSHADGSSWDGSSWDGSSWDGSSWDGSSWDGSSWDGSSWDSASWDASSWDASSWDASRWDASSWDASRWDASRWDASRWDGSSWDGTPPDPGFTNDWYLGATHALDAWNVTTGYHAKTICIVDSGVDYNHPDLKANSKRLANGYYGYDFVNGDNDPMDDAGHGTMMAGIAAGTLGNGHGNAGMSQAWILSAKVIDSTGTGTEANLASGIRWCADNGANIVSMSLHIDADNKPVHDAVAYARSKGLILFAAAGNAGQVCDNCVAYPAAYGEVMGVGASMPNGSRAPFSNGGKQLSFLAPGVSIPGPLPGGRYAVGSGTSHATAVAAGAAALTWAAKTSLSKDGLRDALNKNAKDAGAAGFDNSYGNGHLRLDRTFKALSLI